MAIKYRIAYRDYDNTEKRVDIDLQGYAGAIIPVRTVQGTAFMLSYENQGNDKYQPIVPSSATMQLYSPDVDIEELQTAADMQFQVQWYVNNVLQWQGFLIPDGIQRQLASDPYVIEVRATDGLNLLRGIRFNYRNYGGGRSFSTNLLDILQGDLAVGRTRNPLPLRWINTLTNPAYPGEDIFRTSEMSVDYRGFIDYDVLNDGVQLVGQLKKYSYWVVENIMLALGARIYQADGKWVVERVNDVTTGAYNWSEIDSSNVVTTGAADVNMTIQRGGDYAFIMEDAIVMVDPGVKSVKVTYEQAQTPKTIVPNGDYELTSPQRDDLSDPQANINDWIWWDKRQHPGLQYTYWWNYPPFLPAQSDNGIYGNSITALGDPLEPDPNPDGNRVSFLYNAANSGHAMPVDNRIWREINIRFKYMTFLFSGETLQPYVLLLIWYIQNQFDVGTAVTFKWLTEYGYWKVFDPGEPVIAARVGDPNDPNLVNEVVQINFSTNNAISIPDNSSDSTTFPSDNIRDTDGEIIRGRMSGLVIGLDGGIYQARRTRFDDLEITVPDLNEIWEAVNSAAGTSVTKTQELTQQISSAYTGFYWSNYTKNWSQTYNDFEFVDTFPGGSVSGPLTKILANAVLRNNSAPSRIFQGSINGQFKFGEIYEIQTLPGKYMPLSAEYNSETNITRLTAIQVRNDAVPNAQHLHYTTHTEED